jgi:hypothetical protein
MMHISSKDCFPVDGLESLTKSGRWKAHLENDPDQNANGSDVRVFLLKFDLIEPDKRWSGEKIRRLKLTTSRASLVVEKLGGFLPQVVEGFLLDEKPEGELTCISEGRRSVARPLT